MTMLAIFFVGCAVFVPGGRDGRMPLRIKRHNYLGNEIRTDGFYYNDNCRSFYLYKNGVYLDNGTGGYSDLNRLRNRISEYRMVDNSYKDIVYWWGEFDINYPQIKIDRWVSGEGCSRYGYKEFNGLISNDSTIILNDYPDGATTFRFCKFAKLDSTNRFIE